VRHLGVHLKVDTGMHRVGAPPSCATALAARIESHAPWLRLEGVYTHLAVADELEHPYTQRQLDVFDDVLSQLPPVDVIHAANSAGAFIQPYARRSFVRAGIGLYGVSPGPDVDGAAADLRPVMSLKARVSFVKRLAAGERLSYGLSHQLAADANVATVPLGYADGVRRGLSNVADVLIGGRRRPIIGSITMDQFMVDCGDDPVDRGDEVVLIGRQGDESIGVGELARHLDTIGYEIMCGISPRIPRVHIRSSQRPGAGFS
jgi:alanine racemase